MSKKQMSFEELKKYMKDPGELNEGQPGDPQEQLKANSNLRRPANKGYKNQVSRKRRKKNTKRF